MIRIPEPQLMDDPVQAKAYAEADFTEPHSQFIHYLADFVNEPDFSGTALDLGCGTGDISYRFARAFPACTVHAVDGAEAMLNYAKQGLPAELQTRLQFIKGLLPDVSLPLAHYPIIFSNSLLHHLPDPHILWQSIKKFSQPETRIIVMDLLRPDSEQTARALVAYYAGNEPAILQRDFYQSLLAAFSVEEIKQQLQQSGLDFDLKQTSDRHILITGVMT